MSGRLMTTACFAVGRRCSLGNCGPVAAAPAAERGTTGGAPAGRGADGRAPGRPGTVGADDEVRGAEERGAVATAPAPAAAIATGGGGGGAAATATAAFTPMDGGGGRGAEMR